MKLKNSTDFPDWFLRRMIGWICRQKPIGWKVKHIEEAAFRKVRQDSHTRVNGVAEPWFRKFRVSISDSVFPWSWGGATVGAMGRIKSLVDVTAHEIAHLTQSREVLKGRYREGDADHMAKQVVELFDAQKGPLVAQWMKAPSYATREPKPKTPVQQVRADRARKNLTNWEKKLKYAQNKVKKYKKQVKYYDTALSSE